jgi:hypothetical protein
MRADQIAVVTCECIAFVMWLTHAQKAGKVKYKYFTAYLGIIFLCELANLIAMYLNYTSFNNLILFFAVPLQIIFLITFLIFKRTKQKVLLTSTLIGIYVLAFIAEFIGADTLKNTSFTSFSYGVGNLVLIVAVLASISAFIKANQNVDFYKTPYFWIMLGVVIFYVGAFPYYNFRVFLWGEKQYHSIAYFLHYTSQTFNCIMYLMFGYAAKWIKL